MAASDKGAKKLGTEGIKDAVKAEQSKQQDVFATHGNQAIRAHIAEQKKGPEASNDPFGGTLASLMGPEKKGPQLSEQRSLDKVAEVMNTLMARPEEIPGLLEEGLSPEGRADIVLETVALNLDAESATALSSYGFSGLLENMVISTQAIEHSASGIAEVQALGTFGTILWQMLQEMFIRWEREKAASGSAGPDKNGYQRNMSSLIAELRLGGSSDEPAAQ